MSKGGRHIWLVRGHPCNTEYGRLTVTPPGGPCGPVPPTAPVPGRSDRAGAARRPVPAPRQHRRSRRRPLLRCLRPRQYLRPRRCHRSPAPPTAPVPPVAPAPPTAPVHRPTAISRYLRSASPSGCTVLVPRHDRGVPVTPRGGVDHERVWVNEPVPRTRVIRVRRRAVRRNRIGDAADEHRRRETCRHGDRPCVNRESVATCAPQSGNGDRTVRPSPEEKKRLSGLRGCTLRPLRGWMVVPNPHRASGTIDHTRGTPTPPRQ